MSYPSPLLAEKLDRAALDAMLRRLRKEGRVVRATKHEANPWWRHKNWKRELEAAHAPEPVPEPVKDGKDRTSDYLRKSAIAYYRWIADTIEGGTE